MKRAIRHSIVALLVLILLPTSSHAKVVEQISLVSGLNSANAVFDYRDFDATGLHRKTGFQVGFHLEWFRIGAFSLATEIHYVQKGMVDEIVLTGEDGPEPLGVLRNKNRVDYISLPVHVKTRLPIGTNALYAVIGPRIDFKIGHSSEYFAAVFDEFRPTAFGGDVGLGFETSLFMPLLVNLELRYSMDFTDSYHTDLLNVHNDVIELLVGIGL